METNLIIHHIASSTGAGESSSVKLIVDIKTGEAELVIEKAIIERYPVTDYKKVMDLYNNLNRAGGRKARKLKDLT